MYQLERHGVQAVLVDRDENDLWVRTPSGRMLAVQVKSATEPKRHGHEVTFRYRFYTEKLGASTDLYALVALDRSVVVFCEPKRMKSCWPVETFTEDQMINSLREHLA